MRLHFRFPLLHRFLPRSAAPLLPLLSTLAVLLTVAPARASVFAATRWPQTASGHTVIPVCIIAGSSAEQERTGWFHESNPSLTSVINHVRMALASSWERTGSIRFTGWKPCDALSAAERAGTVGLYIHKDSENVGVLGYSARGNTTVTNTSGDGAGVRFKPWGFGGECIDYDWGDMRMEYDFDCVEQFAIHEFGHVLGFRHEMRHPLTTAACEAKTDEEPFDLGECSSSYSSSTCTIVNPLVYDWDSVMAYFDECADVDGDGGLGSTNLSAWDLAGLKEVYPAPPMGLFDVGVIPNSNTCGAGEEPPIVIHMDDEDDDNDSMLAGWVGATSGSNNTDLAFCRVDGTQLKPLDPKTLPATFAHYAVLQLGIACPSGSSTFWRYFDNEDDDENENFTSGRIVPGVQTTGGTQLAFCIFRPESGAAKMSAFPDLGFSYGVFAGPLLGAVTPVPAIGQIFTDDEDDDNNNSATFPSPTIASNVGAFMVFNENSLMFTAKVR